MPIEARATEGALIGAVLTDPQLLGMLDLPGEDLYLEIHRKIWRCLGSMHAAGRQVDFVTLCDALQAAGELEQIGGPAYLAELVGAVPYPFYPDEWVTTIRDKADRRRALVTAGQIAKAAYDADGDFEAAKGRAIEALSFSPHGGDTRPLAAFVAEFYEQLLERAKHPMDIYGIPTGFADFDRHTAGLQPQELLVLSGDPGLGKTLWVLQVAGNAAAKGRAGAVYELEMGGIQLVRRMVAAITGITARNMRSGRLVTDDYPKLADAVEQLEPLPLHVSDSTGWTTSAIRADLARLKARHNIQWFVVDYMGLLCDTAGENDTERTALISKNLRRICKDLNLAGLAVHSLVKAGLSQGGAVVPGLQHLSGSVKISYDADVVLFINRHIPGQNELPNPNIRTFTFAKFREDDPNKFFNLIKRPGLPAFADCEPRRVDPNGRR